jgi:hypothetical protein
MEPPNVVYAFLGLHYNVFLMPQKFSWTYTDGSSVFETIVCTNIYIYVFKIKNHILY